jgi:hypothetical protein
MTDTDTATRASVIFAAQVREAEEREQAEERALAEQRIGSFLAAEAFLSGDAPSYVNPPSDVSPDGRPLPVVGEHRVARVERLARYVQDHAPEATPAQIEGYRDSAVRVGNDVNTLRQEYGVHAITRKQYKRAEKAFDQIVKVLGPLDANDIRLTWGEA